MYMGLRVILYGPFLTMVSAGRSGRTLVPAAFIVRSAQIAKQVDDTDSTTPITSEVG